MCLHPVGVFMPDKFVTFPSVWYTKIPEAYYLLAQLHQVASSSSSSVPFEWITPPQQMLQLMFYALPPAVPEGNVTNTSNRRLCLLSTLQRRKVKNTIDLRENMQRAGQRERMVKYGRVKERADRSESIPKLRRISFLTKSVNLVVASVKR